MGWTMGTKSKLTMKSKIKISAIILIYLASLYGAVLVFNHVNAWFGIFIAVFTILHAVNKIEKTFNK